VWEGFASGWLDEIDGGLREIVDMTRPEILAMVAERRRHIAAFERRVEAEERVARLLPDDRATPAEYFTTPRRQQKLVTALRDIYGKEQGT
jgi:hypothetical protein